MEESTKDIKDFLKGLGRTPMVTDPVPCITTECDGLLVRIEPLDREWLTHFCEECKQNYTFHWSKMADMGLKGID